MIQRKNHHTFSITVLTTRNFMRINASVNRPSVTDWIPREGWLTVTDIYPILDGKNLQLLDNLNA